MNYKFFYTKIEQIDHSRSLGAKLLPYSCVFGYMWVGVCVCVGGCSRLKERESD